MEAFSLLKYWRGSATSKPLHTPTDCSSSSTTTTATTPIIATASPRSSSSSSDNDEGPYFDLQFSLPAQKSINTLIEEHETDSDSEEEDQEEEQGGGGGGGGDVNLSISSSSSSYDSTKEHFHSDENNEATSSSTPKFRNNLFESSSKFRVLMALKLKKLKENGGEEGKKAETDTLTLSKKLFTVKFIKVEEAPVVTLFSRESSSSSKSESGKGGKGNNERDEEEKRYTKDVMHRYLKMMKPLYVRASKRRFSGQLMGKTSSTPVVAASPPSTAAEVAEVAEVEGVEEVKGGEEVVVESGGGGRNGRSGVKSLKERNLAAGLRVVRRHLGKSKSASAVAMEAQPGSQRRDDSLIQQQDGIQSAILHCKRSFNSSRGNNLQFHVVESSIKFDID